jgi:release factor glutamine methyltransferase
MSISNKKTYNINQILKESSLPRLETELLLAFLLEKEREFILTHPEIKITPALYKKFKTLAAKRSKNWPIAYLTGQKEFYGLNFKVSPSVLTPRPETEMMVEEIIRAVKNNLNSQRPSFIIDLGAGSGAIIIASAHGIKHLFPAHFKIINLAAVDISASALKIAKQNTRKHQLDKKIKFYQGNLLTPLRLERQNLIGRELIIAANLPYLTPTQIKKSPSISREPKIALDGGNDGLRYYRELFKQLVKLDLSGISCQVLCEIDPTQSRGISQLAQRLFPGAKLKITKDLARKNRLLKISRN